MDIPFVRELKREAASQLGTVGSRNHYVDVFEAEDDGAICVGVHFGSRGLGHKIASHYTKLAGGKNGIDVEPAAVLEYLDKVDPEAAKVARERYGCLTPWAEGAIDLRPCRAHQRLSKVRAGRC